MKKTIFIFAGLLAAAALTSCADYSGIPSESTSQPEIVTTQQSSGLTDPSAAFYAFDGVSSPFDVFGGSSSESEGVEIIGKERAVDIALAHVELTLDDVFDVEAELEYDYNGTFWDVEFQYDNYEYSFYIDAESGNVVRNHVELDD